MRRKKYKVSDVVRIGKYRYKILEVVKGGEVYKCLVTAPRRMAYMTECHALMFDIDGELEATH